MFGGDAFAIATVIDAVAYGYVRMKTIGVSLCHSGFAFGMVTTDVGVIATIGANVTFSPG